MQFSISYEYFIHITGKQQHINLSANQKKKKNSFTNWWNKCINTQVKYNWLISAMIVHMKWLNLIFQWLISIRHDLTSILSLNIETPKMGCFTTIRRSRSYNPFKLEFIWNIWVNDMYMPFVDAYEYHWR